MPLRGFLYFGNLYEKYLSKQELSLHVMSLVKIPTPNYVVFYNGTDVRPATEKLYLSDAFQTSDTRKEFEWTATVINLNHSDNHSLLQKCKPLYDYTLLVSKIQNYQRTMSIEDAVNRAIDECVTANVLADFLKTHRAEVLRVYLAEVNEEVLRKNLKAEGFSEGYDSGYNSAILQNEQDNLQKLKEKIFLKVSKGKSLEAIAEELEENIDLLRPFYEELTKEQRGSNP